MLNDLKNRIVFDNAGIELEFDGIRKIGFSNSGTFVFEAYKNNGYSYFTTIPISSIKFRKNNSTKTSFIDNGEYLTIKDDWGNHYNIYCDRNIIDLLIKECIDNEIPEEKQYEH